MNVRLLNIIMIISCLSMLGCSLNYYSYANPYPGGSNTTSRGTSSNSYGPEPGMPSDPGKCYAKCLVSDKFESEYEYFYRYRGDNPFQKGVQETTFVLREASTKWEKKKADRNCLSSDPEDCMVWCLVGTTEETDDYFEVVDTNLIKEFVLDSVEVFTLVKQGGHTEWVEVICETDINRSLYKKIQLALIEKGYAIDKEKANGQVDAATKAELVKFQKQNNLHVGALDFKTLDALGINY